MGSKKGRGAFSVCTSGEYTMKFHFPKHVGENIRMFGDILVLDASVGNHFSVYIEKAYRGSPRMLIDCIQDTSMLIGRQERTVGLRTSTKVRSGL